MMSKDAAVRNKLRSYNPAYVVISHGRGPLKVKGKWWHVG